MLAPWQVAVILALVGLIQIVMLFAQLRLFVVADELKAARKELEELSYAVRRFIDERAKTP